VPVTPLLAESLWARHPHWLLVIRAMIILVAVALIPALILIVRRLRNRKPR
jgi:hypothetical protein